MPHPPPPDDRDAAAGEPIDPDVDLRHSGLDVPGPLDAGVLAAIAAGGAIGAGARYAIGQHWPTPSGSLPATTLAINVVGCALIGILMVLVTNVLRSHRLVRPLLGTGVLGGFTTFSTYAVDIQRLAPHDRGTAFLYLAATPIAALLAVAATAAATRRLVRQGVR